METAKQEAQGRIHGLVGPFLSLSSSAEEDGGAGGYGRRDGGLQGWSRKRMWTSSFPSMTSWCLVVG